MISGDILYIYGRWEREKRHLRPIAYVGVTTVTDCFSYFKI